jgi:DNA-binding CsgD family transcriptional regulator
MATRPPWEQATGTRPPNPYLNPDPAGHPRAKERTRRERGDHLPTADEAAQSIARWHAGRDRWYAEQKRARETPHTDPLLGVLPRKPTLLATREWRVIELTLTHHTVAEIATTLGLKYRTVQTIQHRPHIVAYLEAVRTATLAQIARGEYGAQAILKNAQVAAALKLAQLVATGTSEKIQLDAATHILDRTGLPKSTQVSHTHVHTLLRQFTAPELEAYGTHGHIPDRFKETFTAILGPPETEPVDAEVVPETDTP